MSAGDANRVLMLSSIDEGDYHLGCLTGGNVCWSCKDGSGGEGEESDGLCEHFDF